MIAVEDVILRAADIQLTGDYDVIEDIGAFILPCIQLYTFFFIPFSFTNNHNLI